MQKNFDLKTEQAKVSLKRIRKYQSTIFPSLVAKLFMVAGRNVQAIFLNLYKV